MEYHFKKDYQQQQQQQTYKSRYIPVMEQRWGLVDSATLTVRRS